MSNEWITNRIPLRSDATERKGLVWICVDGKTPHEEYYDEVFLGQAWMPITTPEPYVKPKRYEVESLRDTTSQTTWYEVFDNVQETSLAMRIPTREAAEEIAAIYERVMS